MLEVAFWASAALITYAHVGYPLLAAAVARLRRRRTLGPLERPPRVTLVIAAHDEAGVIERKVQNALALDYPRELLEIVVASDGSTDATARLARRAGADQVLELMRGGKVRAQDAGVRAAGGDVVAFSDANAHWQPDALRELVMPFADRRVGYVCGQVRFVAGDEGNQEGVYWRYEMALRSWESRIAGVTAGNGAIYAVRKEAYVEVDARMGHDLSFPFNLTKRGWRCVYRPSALAVERMTPSVGSELARKRRMMSHTWPIVLRGGMLSPRGYPPAYAWQVYSHRVLRYATPFLHLVLLAATIALVASGDGAVYVIALAAQAALLLGALAARLVPWRPLRLAQYYVAITASSALGLWDWLAHGTAPGWESPAGTR